MAAFPFHRGLAGRRIGQLVGAAALATLIALPMVSCRGVLIGDRTDVAAEICALLEDCYGKEYRCKEIEADLRDASTQTRAGFLSKFDSSVCLASCPAARACLDAAPFCATSGACAFNHDCCNWSKGEAACGSGLAKGQCCKPNGIACGEGDLCCDAKCRDGSCGGYLCKKEGDNCEQDQDCCTSLCAAGTCVRIDCSPLGGKCKTVEDCCQDTIVAEGLDAAIVCEQGFCDLGGSVCLPEGEACAESDQCCEGTSCVLAGNGDPATGDGGFCSLQPCDAFSPCTVEAECCPGFNCIDGSCFDAACLHAGDACTDTCCQGYDCVEGVCTQATCAKSGAPASWICEAEYYDTCSGCDCDCGAHDPDCDLPGQLLFCAGQPATPGAFCDQNDKCDTSQGL